VSRAVERRTAGVLSPTSLINNDCKAPFTPVDWWS